MWKLFTHSPANRTVNTHMFFTQKISWLNMWVCKPAHSVLVFTRLMFIWLSLRSVHVSLFILFYSTSPSSSSYDEYVSAWITDSFTSLRDASNMWVWFFFSFFRFRLCVFHIHMHIQAIQYIHRHIFLRWLAAERFFYFTLYTAAAVVRSKEWRVNISMGDNIRFFFSASSSLWVLSEKNFSYSQTLHVFPYSGERNISFEWYMTLWFVAYRISSKRFMESDLSDLSNRMTCTREVTRQKNNCTQINCLSARAACPKKKKKRLKIYHFFLVVRSF